MDRFIRDRNYNIEDRHIIIVFSENSYNDYVINHAKSKFSLNPFKGLKNFAGALIDPKKFVFPYPMIHVDLAKEYYNFPPGHPILNSAYAMCNIIPNQYVPVSTFHEYFRQLKYSSLIELCGALGAKELFLEYAEVNNKTVNVDLSGNIPTELGSLGLGANIGYNKNRNINDNLSFTFSEENKKVKDYNSPWLSTEPTWSAMKKTRKDNFLKSFKIEYNYLDDFGINGNVAASLNNIGINIGGSYKDFKEIKLKYHVVFW